MREPKKLKSSPTGAGSVDSASNVPVASPLNRQGPKTPRQDPGQTPEPIKEQWGVPTQPATPNAQTRLIKNEFDDVNMKQMQSPSILPPASSPLDQFKKEDPMEKMAQMASSIGGGKDFSRKCVLRIFF